MLRCHREYRTGYSANVGSGLLDGGGAAPPGHQIVSLLTHCPMDVRLSSLSGQTTEQHIGLTELQGATMIHHDTAMMPWVLERDWCEKWRDHTT